MAESTTEPYDVFLCYSWKDKPAADALVAALRARTVDGRRLRVFQDDKEMSDYDLITPEVNAALSRSRCLAVLYTENLPKSAYCRFEIRYALSAAHRLEGSPQRVMAVPRNIAYEDVRPGRLGALRLPHPRSADPEHIADSVAARVARTGSGVFGDAPEPPEPAWHPLPLAGTRSFRGRDLELWDVYDALHDHRDPGLGGAAVARIVGFGGVGKTMLAEQYARVFAADYPGGVFILRGFGSHLADRTGPHQVRGRLADLMVEFAHGLRLDVDARDRAAAARAVRRELADRDLPYLWIVDDLPSGLGHAVFMNLLAPTEQGHTLVTTRYRPDGLDDVWGPAIALGELDEGAALALLTGGTDVPPAERRTALVLAETLGRHPQALAVAAGLVALPGQGGLGGLLDAVRAPGPDVLELGERLWGDLPAGHRASIAATMLRSITHLGAAGHEVLQAASLLSSVPIPRDLLEGMLVRCGTDAESVGARTEAGVAEAARLSLVGEVGTGADARWVVHTMVGRTLRHTDLDSARRAELRAAAVGELTGALLRVPGEYTRPATAELLPHVHEVAAPLADEEHWRLVNEASRVHAEVGDPRTALDWYRRLYEACLRALGPRHETTLTVLAGLGIALGLLGDHEQALADKRAAWEGLAALLGGEDPAVLTARNNMAVTYHEAGRPDLAQGIYREVYRVRRRRLGPQHEDTLTALSNFAIAAGDRGNHRLALRIKRVLHRRTASVLGDEHPMTLDMLNNLAASVFALGDRAEAHDLLVGVHEGRARVLGGDHVDTLTALENAAVTAASRDEAVPAFEHVYRRRLHVLGPEHPDTVRALLNVLVWALPARTVAEAKEEAGDDDPDSPAELTAILALRLHELRVGQHGPDDLRTLVAACLLAHGLALQGSGKGAEPVILDAEEGLVQELGSRAPASAAARVLRGWIEEQEYG